MKIRRNKRLSYAESCATSDIAFLLIIYFMVIAGFNINQGFILTLPARDSTRLILKEELMRFEMDNRGAIFYEGNVMDRRTAERQIQAAVAEHPNLAVVLTIDPEAPWQEVVSFVELAQKLEVDAFSFRIGTGT